MGITVVGGQKGGDKNARRQKARMGEGCVPFLSASSHRSHRVLVWGAPAQGSVRPLAALWARVGARRLGPAIRRGRAAAPRGRPEPLPRPGAPPLAIPLPSPPLSSPPFTFLAACGARPPPPARTASASAEPPEPELGEGAPPAAPPRTDSRFGAPAPCPCRRDTPPALLSSASSRRTHGAAERPGGRAGARRRRRGREGARGRPTGAARGARSPRALRDCRPPRRRPCGPREPGLRSVNRTGVAGGRWDPGSWRRNPAGMRR